MYRGICGLIRSVVEGSKAPKGVLGKPMYPINSNNFDSVAYS